MQRNSIKIRTKRQERHSELDPQAQFGVDKKAPKFSILITKSANRSKASFRAIKCEEKHVILPFIR